MERIFHIWPSAKDLAGDLGLPYPTVASWRQRGIPRQRFAQIIVAARKRGAAITFEELESSRATADALAQTLLDESSP